MVEPLTSRPARLGNIAHIVADKVNGPRGNDPLPLTKRSEPDNLMLMCTMHHAFIDKRKNVPTYPVVRLRHFKHIHEARVRLVTGMSATAKTHAVRFFGQVRGNLVTISDKEMFDAVFAHEQRYADADVLDIDLGAVPDTANDAYWTIGRQKIDEALRQRIFPLIERGDIKRLSIFTLARIPLLAYFGHQLGDKVPLELYQKHRTAGEGWAWPSSGHDVQFEIVAHGDASSESVALLVSVSGGDIGKVQQATKAGLIYEIRPISETPSRLLLDAPTTLENFRRTYHEFMSMVEAQHRSIPSMDYFLAAPAPIAVICGRDLAKDVGPKVVFHDLVDDEYRVAFKIQ